MGVRADPGSLRWCLALSRQRNSFATTSIEEATPFYKQLTAPPQPNTTITSPTIKSPQYAAAITGTGSTSTVPSSTTKSPRHHHHQRPYQPHHYSHHSSSAPCTSTSTTSAASSTVVRTHHFLLSVVYAATATLLLAIIGAGADTSANNNSILPGQQDAIHITAILGESVVFNCHVEFPGDHPVPYVLQWEKKVSETGQEIPIYIWYENYPTHSGEGYEGRVSRVSADSPFGAASLNLTNIRENDQGWYECKVVFLNRSPNQHKNGSWFHLDVHAPPRFSVTPEDIVYVNLGDSIILNCQSDGTPTPEILWYKDANPVDPSSTVGIFNDGTELRISTIRNEDIGDYTCIARNGEGQVSHTARVIIAGGAVIMVPPTNQTKLEGEKATFTCEAKAMPGNVTVRWFREGAPVREVASLETRVTIRKDGSLIINPVSADDSGQYLCEVTNGIGDPQSAAAHLNVEYPAKVTFTPTVQYLPFRLAGVVQCYIKSNPPLQYVTWTKDKRLLEPYQTKDIVIMNNGSLLFTRVNQNHQGRYTCTPYNAQGTQGSSGTMEVLVRKPPVFTIEPDPLYQRKVGESVEMHCDAQEAEGTQRPNIQWQRRDGQVLQRNRVKSLGGNITIENLRRLDFGYYQCVASNEVATIVSATQLVIEGTQPHAPYNVSGTATESTVTMSWMPGYSGGPDYKQDYTIYYREGGVSDWQQIPVTPSGSTQVTINKLTPGTTYEFQVAGKNVLGDGMLSKVVTIRTLDVTKPRIVKTTTIVPAVNDHKFKDAPEDADILNYRRGAIMFPTDATGSTYFPPIFRPTGPKPGQPRNLTVTEIPNGFLISWEHPIDRVHLIEFYTIKYRTDAQWKTLNRGQIRAEETTYLVKNLVGGRTYYFRVLANSLKSYESSDEVKFPVPARVKHKAITAGVVGGILFFIVAIILSICAVKICNKRKRRKQEKAYNMVACRTTDARYAATALGRSGTLLHQSGGVGGSGAAAGVSHNQITTSAMAAYPQTTTTTTTTNMSTSNAMATTPKSRVAGSAASGQVPLKKPKYSRLPGLNIVCAIFRWIWPADRCTNCHSIYTISKGGKDFYHLATTGKHVDHIHRTPDGRFVIGEDGIERVLELAASTHPREQRCSVAVSTTSSDDGGFLSKRGWAAWRRKPIVGQSPSRMYDPLGGTDEVDSVGVGGGLLSIPQRYLHTVAVDVHRRNFDQNLHIDTLPARRCDEHLPAHQVYSNTPSGRLSRFVASSPAASSVVGSPWSPHTMYFSDLSSVQQPSFADRSFPTPQSSGINQLRYLQERYSQELPSLRAIHEETKRMAQGFVPLHIQLHSPSWRYSQQPSSSGLHHHHGHTFHHRHRSRLLPRYGRLARSAPDLGSPTSSQHLNMAMVDVSPESRSSSSGFGSKNTSTQHNQSSQSGSTNNAEWRYLPPYRPPPPPPVHYQNFNPKPFHNPAPVLSLDPEPIIPTVATDQEPHSMNHWLELIHRLNAASDPVHVPKSVDVGSVDGHYEFDQVTITPTASTPTGHRDDHLTNISVEPHFYQSLPSMHTLMPSTSSTIATSTRKSRISSKYDNIEARVQAMKEEFYEFRKRQATRHAGIAGELESAC